MHEHLIRSLIVHFLVFRWQIEQFHEVLLNKFETTQIKDFIWNFSYECLSFPSILDVQFSGVITYKYTMSLFFWSTNELKISEVYQHNLYIS